MRGLIALLILLLLFSGCVREGAPGEPFSETRFLLDTVCTITVYGARGKAILDEAFDLCAEYEALLSVTIEGSDVWRINHAGGEPVAVAPQTLEVIKLGIEYGELSGGMFDITIGRLSSLWDFSGNSGVPSEADLELARYTVDYRQIMIEGDTVRLGDPEARLDLGGIAKGYIAGRLADFLRGSGVSGAIIDLGGDVAIVGAKPDGTHWRIGVRQPFGARNELLGAVDTGEASIVSSGIYERLFEENGVIYHHILDPFTGMPAISDVISVTVLTESSVIGDIISTIVLLAGAASSGQWRDSAIWGHCFSGYMNRRFKFYYCFVHICPRKKGWAAAHP
jgi:thiamine biosynthesis lipoprotein